MASFWSTAVNNIVKNDNFEAFNFIQILVDQQLLKSDLTNNTDLGVFLCDYHDNIVIGGNEYIADLTRGVSLPSVTGNLSQETQTLFVNQQLGSFSDQDFIAALGPNYHLAQVIITSYLVNASGTLLTSDADIFFRSDGILQGITRDVSAGTIGVQVSNSFGQLDLIQELRTTIGSLKRISDTDTSFDAAAAIDPNLSLQWGREV